MNRIERVICLAAGFLPLVAVGLTEEEIAAAGRAYLAPMTSMGYWRMRMPDGKVREFEVKDDRGTFRFNSADKWTGAVRPGNRILISTPRKEKPKVEWGFCNGTLEMIAEDGNAIGLKYDNPIVYENEKIVPLWPEAKELKKKDVQTGGTWKRDRRRLKIGFESPNRAGVFLASLALVALAAAFRVRRRWGRIVAGLATAGVLVPMLLTGSRGAALSFAAAAALLVFFELRRLRLSRRAWMVVVGSGLLVVVIMASLLLGGAVRSRKSNRGSDRTRARVMEMVPRMFRDAPQGWGRPGQVGAAYTDWYGSRRDDKFRFNLISEHATAVVARGWVRGGLYLFFWFGGILLLILFAFRGGSPLPAALWLVLLIAPMFNLIFAERSVWVLPILSLVLLLTGRCWRMPWIFLWGPLGGALLAVVTVFGLLAIANTGNEPRPGIRCENGRRLLIGGRNPVIWVVDDRQVLGHVMTGRDIRDHYEGNRYSSAIGYVRSLRDLPELGSIRRLVLAGSAGRDWLDGLAKDGIPERLPAAVRFLSPTFAPSEIPEELRRRTDVSIVIGEFAARYHREYLAKQPWISIVPGAELYLPKWMRFVVGP